MPFMWLTIGIVAAGMATVSPGIAVLFLVLPILAMVLPLPVAFLLWLVVCATFSAVRHLKAVAPRPLTPTE